MTEAKKTIVKSKTTKKKKVASKRKVTRKKNSTGAKTVTYEQRWRMIAEAAYLRAEKRQFQVGRDVDDWLAAEADIDSRLRRDGKKLVK